MNGVDVAGVDVGENESTIRLFLQRSDVKERFTFSMDENGYNDFSLKVPRNARIAFYASGRANDVNSRLRSLGCSDITVVSSWLHINRYSSLPEHLCSLCRRRNARKYSCRSVGSCRIYLQMHPAGICAKIFKHSLVYFALLLRALNPIIIQSLAPVFHLKPYSTNN